MPGRGLRQVHASQSSCGHTQISSSGTRLRSRSWIRFDLGACLRAPGDVGLIGHDDEDEAGLPQVGARLGDTGQHAELFE